MRSRIGSESPTALLRTTRTLLWALTTSALGCTVVDGLFVPPSTPDAGGGREIGSDAGMTTTAGDAMSDGAGAIGAGDAGGTLQDGEVADALSLCPITPCPGNQVCCYVSKSATSGAYRCMASCPNDVAPVACAGPQQCTSGAPVCCGTVLGAGVIPNCPAVAMSSSCTASCTTNIALGCNATDTLRLCHDKADCDSNNPNCCSYPGSGLSSFLCVSDLFRDALNLPCAP